MTRRDVPTMCAVAVFVMAAGAVRGEVKRVSNSDALRRAAASAKPGDTIALEPGRYAGGVTLAHLRGEEGRPITIAAHDPKVPPIIEGGSECLHLVNPSHVVLSDLVLRGPKYNALNIDDGGTMKATAKGVVLRRLRVESVTSSGNFDGIKLSGVTDFRIEQCSVREWGDGGSAIDMVGCHRGVIVGCTIEHRDATAANTGIQCKGGTREVTIDGCRFVDAGRRAINIGGSTGLKYFRPQPPPGYEAKDITVRRCTFIGGNCAVAFVGCDGAVVEYNTIYRPRRWVMRILQETRAEGFAPARNGRFEHNIVVWRSNELHSPINIGDATAPQTFQFAGNVWYCADQPKRSRAALPVSEKDGRYGVDPKLTDPERGDLRPASGSPARNVGAHAEVPAP